MFVVRDWLGVCSDFRHKGSIKKFPCPAVLGTKASSQRWQALDMAFGSIWDESRRSPARQIAQIIDLLTALRGGEHVASESGSATHLSIERPSLLITDPRQIVPTLVPLGIGITRWLVRLAVEASILEGSLLLCWLYADTLAKLLAARLGCRTFPTMGGIALGDTVIQSRRGAMGCVERSPGMLLTSGKLRTAALGIFVGSPSNPKPGC